MSSRYPSSAGSSNSPISSKGKSPASDTPPQDDDGWEVYGKRSKNKTVGSVSSKHFGPTAWGRPDTAEALGIRSHGGGLPQTQTQTWSTVTSSASIIKPQSSSYTVFGSSNYPAPAIPSTEDSRRSLTDEKALTPGNFDDESDDDDDDDDDDEDDDYDSDESQKSHETSKKNKWFKELFACLDGLTIEQINDTERQWHCPACKGGPGAIDWYRGLQPLITHARTKRSKRVKLHRELAQLLDEELQRRGTSAIPAGEIFGKWKGLEERADRQIVWPPMVMIMNTRHEKDENDRWIGMGNQELLESFSSYSAVRARHSYGPQGHRGISVLIFEPSAVGYIEAERLSNHFEETCRDRVAWGRYRMPFYPGGKRQLYGFMAQKQDLDNFNQHSQGKSKLKYEMKSYQEMVVNHMKQMSEDNQQLIWFKNKVVKEQKSKKALEETFGIITERLRKTVEENRMVKLRTKKHHEQNREEMDFQERFFKDQMQLFYDARNAKEENFEKTQQDQRQKLTQTNENLSSAEERVRRAEEIASFIKLQDKEMEEFMRERDGLVNSHEQRMLDLKRRHFEEIADLEKQFDAEFNLLLEKFSPHESKGKEKVGVY